MALSTTTFIEHKEQQAIESRFHDALYNNIFLITKVHPTTREFDEIFKKNMFAKNNKAAFHQVIYYLLNVLDPTKLKEKITTWPIYEPRMEGKFRTEILSYIEEIRNNNEEIEIPNIMASHLICPGGFKFVFFMYKLSQFVLYSHLKKNGYTVYVSQKNPNEQSLKTLKKYTTKVEKKTKLELNRIYNKIQCSKTRAIQILNVHQELNKVLVLSKSNNQHPVTEATFNLFVENILKKIDQVNVQLGILNQITETCKTNTDILKYLLSEDSALEYRVGCFEIPQFMTHLFQTETPLNLIEFFKGLNLFLEQYSFDKSVNIINHIDLNMCFKLYTRLVEMLNKINKQMLLSSEQLVKMAENCDIFKGK